MTTTLSSKGQLVLPAPLRRKLALQPGDALEITLESAGGEPRIVMRKRITRRAGMKIVADSLTGWPVLKASAGRARLTGEMVREMLTDFP